MLLIRNIIYWLVLCVVTPFFFLLLVLALPLPRRRRHVIGLVWTKLLLWVLEHIVGLSYQLIGAEHIPTQPSVICAKHQSGWETLALQKIFPPQVYVAKRELVWIPIFGWGLLAMNAIIINRKNKFRANQQIMVQGKERFRHGFWISVFPEGTRIKPGKRGKYKAGAIRLAQVLGAPVVPVAHNAGEFWPRNSFLKYPGVITVVVGPALYPSPDDTPEGMMAKVEEWIEAQQQRIGGVGPHADPKVRSSVLTTEARPPS